ncbi:6-phosphogluconate dehydrogenase C-terminal domain-like protein [Myriangium duriaei CBS 260.36]|uniref:6-phosphogluconate dehydrogenase C-terminal domain-like protein n=1 Tax=Myriangium duriaei CBS 260.36 TaxID=1168546 RepID=A0A9P4IVN4_9PEZI|nr:6-phosphogluconate dehydrogenase C-terminal domain-like protein [Myriangium duriaei CBS 260.36]
MSSTQPRADQDATNERGQRQPSRQREGEHISDRIHILGLGAIGKLIAHSLRGIPQSPPVTLLTHRRGLFGEWTNGNKEIVIEQDGRRQGERKFDMELALSPQRFHGLGIEHLEYLFNNPEGLSPHDAAARLKQDRGDEVGNYDPSDFSLGRELDRSESDEPIYNLIVTVKAHLTVSALLAVRHRLRPESAICFLQNGMGIIDQVNDFVFPDPKTRPHYIQGIVSHGVNSPAGSDPFFAIHAGRGTIALTVLPRTDRPETDISAPVPHSPSARYLMRTLTRTPILAAIGVPHVEFLQQKLEKLAQNAVVNPMTVLLDARNGALNYNFALTKVTRLLLGEVSLILRSLPELQGLPNLATRFSPERLETLVVAIATKTERNISSMLADVRNGRATEVKYINGYIVKRGEELGVSCLCNYLVMQTVIGKAKMVGDERRDALLTEAPGDLPGQG